MLGAAYRDGAWCSAVETDSFFVPGQQFDVTCLPMHGMEGKFNGAFPALLCGGGEFIVNVLADARVLLEEYRMPCPDRSELCIRIGSGNLHASRMLDGIEQEPARVRGVFGSGLRNWTYETFPKSCVQVNALEGMGMPVFAEGEVFIFGVNLREQPTGQSPSMGKYTAIVRLLDRREGTHAPWYQVQFVFLRCLMNKIPQKPKLLRFRPEEFLPICLKQARSENGVWELITSQGGGDDVPNVFPMFSLLTPPGTHPQSG